MSGRCDAPVMTSKEEVSGEFNGIFDCLVSVVEYFH